MNAPRALSSFHGPGWGPVLVVLVGLALCTLVSARAAADDAPQDRHARAAAHFERALERVNAGDLAEGLLEFRAAHALVPSVVVVYNVGLLYAALERPVEASRSLREALAQGAELDPDTRSHAQRVCAEQELRIGFVSISVAAPEPDHQQEGVIEVDNVETAALPVAAPLPVAAGSHVIGVIAKGHAPARKEAIVVSREQLALGFSLVPIEARLGHVELSSDLPGADVFVDDERVGRTPLEASITVTPGLHTIRVSRAGYVSEERSVKLSDGARAQLRLSPSLDPAALQQAAGELALVSSEPLSVVSVDGVAQGLLGPTLRLPPGPHHIRVERGGFLPAERDVSLVQGATLQLSVRLEPTPETRAHYIEHSRRQRRVRGALLGLGGLVAGGGLALGLVAQRNLGSAEDEQQQVKDDWERGAGGACDMSEELSTPELSECQTRLSNAEDEVTKQRALMITGYSLAGLGAATALVSALLLWRADDPDHYERRGGATLPGLKLSPTFGVRRVGLDVSGRF